MTSTYPDNLTSVIFRAQYPDYDLVTIGVLHIVVPAGTLVLMATASALLPGRSPNMRILRSSWPT